MLAQYLLNLVTLRTSLNLVGSRIRMFGIRVWKPRMGQPLLEPGGRGRQAWDFWSRDAAAPSHWLDRQMCAALLPRRRVGRDEHPSGAEQISLKGELIAEQKAISMRHQAEERIRDPLKSLPRPLPLYVCDQNESYTYKQNLRNS